LSKQILSQTFLKNLAQSRNLSEDLTTVLLMRLGKGLSYEEISRELHVSPDTARKKIALLCSIFGIVGETKGKENQLKVLLLQQQRHTTLHSSSEIKPIRYEHTEEQESDKTYWSDTTLQIRDESMDEPHNIVHELLQELRASGASHAQITLYKLGRILPQLIQTKAVRSPRTELELTDEFLEWLWQWLADKNIRHRN